MELARKFLKVIAVAILCAAGAMGRGIASAATINFAFHDGNSNAIPNTKVIVSPVSGPSVSAQWVTGGNTSWFTTDSGGLGQLASMPPGFYGVRLFTSPTMIFEISVPPGGGTYNASDITVPFPWLTFAQTYFAPTVQTVNTTNAASTLVLTTNGQGGLVWTLYSGTNSPGANPGAAVTVNTTNATSALVLTTNAQGGLVWTLYSATNSPGGPGGSGALDPALFKTNGMGQATLKNPALTNNQATPATLADGLTVTGNPITADGSGLSNIPLAALQSGAASNIVVTAADGTHHDTNAISATLIGIVPAANLPLATSSTPGIVKPGAGLTVDAGGALGTTAATPKVSVQFSGTGATGNPLGFIGPTTNLHNIGDIKNSGIVYTHYLTVSNTITFPGFNEEIGDDGSGNLSIYNPFGTVDINSGSFGASGDGTLKAQLPITDFNNGTGANSSTYWRGDRTWATPSGGGGGTIFFNEGQIFTNGDGQISLLDGFSGTNYNENGVLTFVAGGEEIQDNSGTLSIYSPTGVSIDSTAPGAFDGTVVLGQLDVVTGVGLSTSAQIVFNGTSDVISDDGRGDFSILKSSDEGQVTIDSSAQGASDGALIGGIIVSTMWISTSGGGLIQGSSGSFMSLGVSGNGVVIDGNSSTPGTGDGSLLAGVVQSAAYISTDQNGDGPATISVGSSPFSYTSSQPENIHVYIGGGIVTAISKNGTSIASGLTLTGLSSVDLQNGETVTVTYTSIPTMTWAAF